MRINAYVLIADPSFLAESIRAYYDRVDRIILSYDESSTSWTGTPLPVAECLTIVEELDVDGKCIHAAGHYARLDHDPLENDTYQRQKALDLASDGADWVLQLDTDEVMWDADQFFWSLSRAEAIGCSGMDYPSRWLYAEVGSNRYLEASTRFWRAAASYPGPLAVRAGTRLSLARQCDVPLYRVDLRAWNTDPAHHHESIVHEVIAPASAVMHFSWVRDHDTMRRKFGWSGHTAAYSRPEVYERWARRQRHPWRTVLMNPFRRREPYRIVSLPGYGGEQQ